eukprot:scaffold6958_cov107-Isochrysis_galbana.AAC.1
MATAIAVELERRGRAVAVPVKPHRFPSVQLRHVREQARPDARSQLLIDNAETFPVEESLVLLWPKIVGSCRLQSERHSRRHQLDALVGAQEGIDGDDEPRAIRSQLAPCQLGRSVR